MLIKGFEPFTLIDYPGNLACTIFLFGCNFRCGFCHNPELVTTPANTDFSKEEILAFLKKRISHLDGVCFTGGEPLLTLDVDFLREIKAMGYKIKLDTNGSFPDKLEVLLKDNLIDFVSMDIKSNAKKYSELASAKVSIKKIEKSIKLITSNLKTYEFRTTILKELHPVADLKEMSLWLNTLAGKKPLLFSLQGFKNKGKLVNPSFAKYMDTSDAFLENLQTVLIPFFETVEIKT